MYINEIKVLSDRLQAFGEMSNKGGNWTQYVEKTLREMETAIAGLRTEICEREARELEFKDNWSKMVSKTNRANTFFNEVD